MTDDCVVERSMKTLYIFHSQTGFSGTFLRSHLFLNWALTSPMTTEETIGKSTFPLQLILFLSYRTSDMAQLSVVLSGSCSQQCESRRGNADLSADKEVVDFLTPRRVSQPYRLKVIPVSRSSCSGNVSLKALHYSQKNPKKNINFVSKLSQGHPWWPGEELQLRLSHLSMHDNKRVRYLKIGSIIGAFSPKWWNVTIGREALATLHLHAGTCRPRSRAESCTTHHFQSGCQHQQIGSKAIGLLTSTADAILFVSKCVTWIVSVLLPLLWLPPPCVPSVMCLAADSSSFSLLMLFFL